MRKLYLFLLLLPFLAKAQVNWKKVDDLFQPLPSGVHVYYTNDSLDGKPNKAYYLSAELKNPSLGFFTQVGNGKRYTPTQYFEKEGHPLVVVNGTFFEFVNNSNLNLVMNDGKLLAYNQQTVAGKGKDTLTFKHKLASAIGIDDKGNADIAWTYTDSASSFPLAVQSPLGPVKDSLPTFQPTLLGASAKWEKWKMKTAIGGGPVLVQNGLVQITNNEEMKFSGKAVFDKHPRTAIGYTKDGLLIIMALEGRFPGKAEGADLKQLANLLAQLGCQEAMNLDGGGSSCLLINGKETITPSDKEGQRPVPGVLLIQEKSK